MDSSQPAPNAYWHTHIIVSMQYTCHIESVQDIIERFTGLIFIVCELRLCIYVVCINFCLNLYKFPWICLSNGQAEFELVPLRGAHGDALLRCVPPAPNPYKSVSEVSNSCMSFAITRVITGSSYTEFTVSRERDTKAPCCDIVTCLKQLLPIIFSNIVTRWFFQQISLLFFSLHRDMQKISCYVSEHTIIHADFQGGSRTEFISSSFNCF